MLRLVLAAFVLMTGATALAEPLELTPDENGVSSAPIHGEDVAFTFTFKTPWPADRPKPEILERSLWIHWSGRAHTAKGQPLAALYVRVKLAVPAGAGLSAHLSHPLSPTHLLTDDRDAYDFELPITRMSGNHAGFFVRLGDSMLSEFTLEYELRLSETVMGFNKECEPLGVRFRELEGADRRGGFLFASCVREDRMLYINVLRPLDRQWAGSGRDSTQVPMRPEHTPARDRITELALTDGKEQGSRYEVTFVSEGPIGFRLAFGLAPAYYSYTDNFPGGPNAFRQLSLLGTMSLGYLFAPGHFELALDAKGSISSFMLSASPQPAADWYSLGYSLGYLLPVKDGTHTFGFYLGFYHYFMTVSGNGYGLPRQGLTNIAGPQLTINMRFNPLGRLGWTGYFKYAPISDTLESLDLSKFRQHDITVGAAIDLPFLDGHLRRPAVFVEGGFAAYSFNAVDMNESHVMTGLLYPLR